MTLGHEGAGADAGEGRRREGETDASQPGASHV